jgi:hypothetical protein
MAEDADLLDEPGNVFATNFGFFFTDCLVTIFLKGLAISFVDGMTGFLLTGGTIFGFEITLGLIGTVAVRAGVTETAEAQMVTLPEDTCEPTRCEPEAPPEFLHDAQLGCGAAATRHNIRAIARSE